MYVAYPEDGLQLTHVFASGSFIEFRMICGTNVTIFHPLSQARIHDAVQNPLNILKAAWAGKVSRYAAMVHEAGRSVQLLPVPISTSGGWHPDAHRALCSVATAIAARGISTFSSAKGILFQRHTALLVTNNEQCSLPHVR